MTMLLKIEIPMFKNRNNENFLNTRQIRTRLHDAPVFVTIKPNCEKFKNSVFYKGATHWNSLSANTRNIETYEKFKNSQKLWALSQL